MNQIWIDVCTWIFSWWHVQIVFLFSYEMYGKHSAVANYTLTDSYAKKLKRSWPCRASSATESSDASLRILGQPNALTSPCWTTVFETSPWRFNLKTPPGSLINPTATVEAFADSVDEEEVSTAMQHLRYRAESCAQLRGRPFKAQLAKLRKWFGDVSEQGTCTNSALICDIFQFSWVEVRFINARKGLQFLAQNQAKSNMTCCRVFPQNIVCAQ